MTADHVILLCLLFLPLVAAVIVWCLGPTRGPQIRTVSAAASVVVLALAALLAGRFMSLDRTAGAGVATFVPEFVPGSTTGAPHKTTWDVVPMGNGAVQFYVGVDRLNLWLVVLTAVLMLPSVLVSFNYITERVNEFYAWLLALQTAM